MSYQVYITRAGFWAENEGAEISAEEWLDVIEKDTELKPDEANGPHFVVIDGSGGSATSWLDWSEGNICTNAPDPRLQEKILQIADQLGAVIQGDDGERYASVADFPEVTDREQASAGAGDRLPAYKRRQILWQIIGYGVIAAAIVAVNVFDVW